MFKTILIGAVDCASKCLWRIQRNFEWKAGCNLGNLQRQNGKTLPEINPTMSQNRKNRGHGRLFVPVSSNTVTFAVEMPISKFKVVDLEPNRSQTSIVYNSIIIYIGYWLWLVSEDAFNKSASLKVKHQKRAKLPEWVNLLCVCRGGGGGGNFGLRKQAESPVVAYFLMARVAFAFFLGQKLLPPSNCRNHRLV